MAFATVRRCGRVTRAVRGIASHSNAASAKPADMPAAAHAIVIRQPRKLATVVVITPDSIRVERRSFGSEVRSAGLGWQAGIPLTYVTSALAQQGLDPLSAEGFPTHGATAVFVIRTMAGSRLCCHGDCRRYKRRACCTAVRMPDACPAVLSTQALLYAVGLGSGSIPLAAALNWVRPHSCRRCQRLGVSTPRPVGR